MDECNILIWANMLTINIEQIPFHSDLLPIKKP